MKIDLKFKIKNLKFENVHIFLSLLLVLFYFLTRLIHLTMIPVFADEAIYVRWAQVMRAVASLRFLPLSDGKQPLFMWLIIPFLKIFENPLVAGRMVSVLAGFGSMTGIGILTYLLFKKKEISFFASLLYIVSPFTLFFDRMALADGLLSMFGIWFLILSVLLVNNQRLDLSMLAGIVLGLGLITKSPALFFALMLPLSMTVVNNLTMKQFNNKLKLFGLWFIIYLFAFAIYNILRLGPEFHMIAIRNKDYVYQFSEILKHPLNPLVGHLKDVASWYWILLTPLIFISGIAGIYLSFKKNIKPTMLILICWIFPIITQSAIAKVFTSRYVLWTVPLFLIFSAVAIEKFWRETKSKLLVIGGLVIILLFPAYQSLLLINIPQKAWLPEEERRGYLEIWTAGYGIKETADYLKEIAKTQKVLVGTEGYFGTLPDGLQIYLEKVPNITVIGAGYPIKNISSKLSDGLIDSRVFLLVNDSRFNCPSCNLKLINQYPKTENPKTKTIEHLLFFELQNH